MLIIGDSHTRSFSYSPHAYPVFLTSGKHLLLNSVEEQEATYLKIKDFLLQVPMNNIVYAVIGEPSIRYFLESCALEQNQVSNKTIEEYPSGLVSAMKKLSSRLKEEVGHTLVFLPPIPRKDPEYAKLWVRIVKELQAKGFELATVFDLAVDQNYQIKDSYFGDYIHANEKLADLFYQKTVEHFKPSSNKYKWCFRYDFKNGEAVWGEADIRFLKYSGTAPRDFKKICHKTQTLKQIVKAVDLIDILHGRKGKICTEIYSRDEGAWGFYSKDHCIFMSNDTLRKSRFDWLMSPKQKTSAPNNRFRRAILDKEASIESLRAHLNMCDEVICFTEIPINYKLEGFRIVTLKIDSLHVSIFTKATFAFIYKKIILMIKRF